MNKMLKLSLKESSLKKGTIVVWQYKNVETGKVVVIESVEGHNRFFENRNPHDWVLISVAKNKEGS